MAKGKMPLALPCPQSYFRHMKRFFSICALGMVSALLNLQARAGDGTTPLPPSSSQSQGQSTAAAIATRQSAQEDYNSLKGQVEDLTAAQADNLKKIEELRKTIEELRQKLDKPSGNFASQDDLKQLADAVKELDKKREADKDLILKEMEKIGQTVSGTSTHVSTPHSHDTPSSNTTSTATPTQNDGNGFYYTIKKDDTIGLIAQAYREQGVKVTSKQITDANPNLNPAKLHVGMKIFIPAPKGSTLK
jgi:hypothetical protein